ncbi:class I SAM-dependent methyltransferase [Allokutzneria albata]|uniref:O-Methyltransferase involved in polyketide biosynthesis n=1 Tax=Allokutzneria albata TaxID=211114 RepID=A0A1G9S918_ALLAB|nr:class I SAM-dependent methyltransferase [Allokutzneria albata]SDM32013.1 O-Methyltransferase involved in polyketide biosynthesis [Allokutzneria albata]
MKLTGVQATLLPTLYCRAVDASADKPILGDRVALATLRRIEADPDFEVDFSKVGMRPGDESAVAIRARHIDGQVADFLAAHPRATVLHIGCGLDSRAHRVDHGAEVRWIDVDYPEIVALRRRLVPEPPGDYTALGTSVTAPGWLAEVPTDRPVLVVAEGLTMYLDAGDGRLLFRGLAEYFPSGTLVFDALSTTGVKLSRRAKAIKVARAQVLWGIDSPRELESIHPSLRCAAVLNAFDLEGFVVSTTLRGRLATRVLGRIPALRQMLSIYRLEW